MATGKRKISERVGDMLELPKEVVSKVPKISITGKEEILIENYEGIVEYEDCYIKLNTGIGSISIDGTDIEVIQITKEDLKVVGTLNSIEFL